jgi:hypothetical protein
VNQPQPLTCPGHGEPCGYITSPDGPQYCPVHGVISSQAPDIPLLPSDDATGQHFCPECCEPCDGPNVEAYELTGEVVCDDCAALLMEQTA